jgi:hypothetical protein
MALCRGQCLSLNFKATHVIPSRSAQSSLHIVSPPQVMFLVRVVFLLCSAGLAHLQLDGQ